MTLYRRLLQLGFGSDEAVQITVDYFLATEPQPPGYARAWLINYAREKRGHFGLSERIRKEAYLKENAGDISRAKKQTDLLEMNVPDEFKARKARQ